MEVGKRGVGERCNSVNNKNNKIKTIHSIATVPISRSSVSSV